MIEFKDKFELDGRVLAPKGVTIESVAKVAGLVAEASRGSYVANAQLTESMMSGVLARSVAHFINVITIPQLPLDKERPVAKLAGFRQVPDFRPATLFSLFGNGLKGPGVEADGSAARVPQGTPYPVATISGQESAYSKLGKRGLRINWDFEDFVNDAVGVLDGMPSELQEVALQTEWAEVGDAILKANVALPTVTLPDGTVMPINAVISANAIFGAIQALSVKKVNGKAIGTRSGYNIVVPVGQKLYVDYMIQQALSVLYVLPGSTGGSVMPAPDNGLLRTVEVIEHESITGTNWYLYPKPGAYNRPIIDVLRLRGYETPQIRVKTDGGDGFSFDSDSASMRLRLVVGSALWFQEAILWSKGTGVA